MTKKEIENLTPAQLKDFINRGILQVMQKQTIPQKIEDTPEYKKNAKLKGQPIHLSEASRKYDIPKSTISRYVKLGIIKTLGKDGNKIILDHSYVAYVNAVMQSRPGAGKWLFDQDGLPYTPETS